jgi:hypothetical protein
MSRTIYPDQTSPADSGRPRYDRGLARKGRPPEPYQTERDDPGLLALLTPADRTPKSPEQSLQFARFVTDPRLGHRPPGPGGAGRR